MKIIFLEARKMESLFNFEEKVELKSDTKVSKAIISYELSVKNDVELEYSHTIDNEDIFKHITSQFDKQKLHHGIIFIGVNNTNKINLMHDISKYIIYSSRDLSVTNTAQLLNSFSHPDILEIGDGISDINVDQIRGIISFINLKSSLSTSKVIILNSIDKVNISGVNALLKVLEEPQVDVFILLNCENYSNILPTIKSRCIKCVVSNDDHVNFHAFEKIKQLSLKDAMILKYLSNADKDSAIKLLNIKILDFINLITEHILSKYFDPTFLKDVNEYNYSLENMHLALKYIIFLLNPLSSEAIYTPVNCNEKLTTIINELRKNRKIIFNYFELQGSINRIFMDASKFNLDKLHAYHAAIIEITKFLK